MSQTGYTSIRDWPDEDRPREKLWSKGEHQLSDSELLAILIRSGSQGQSALDLARDIIRCFGGFRKMAHTDPGVWRRFKGLGPAKLAQIRAALEIGRRAAGETVSSGNKVNSSADAAALLMHRLRDLKIEVFKVIMLDAKNRVIKIVEVEEGTVDRAAPLVREVFHRALQNFAVSLICIHNHPSGDCQPSREDREFTARLAEVARGLQVRLLDHIIIGDGIFYSFADDGKI